jgi:hypothetical protein
MMLSNLLDAAKRYVKSRTRRRLMWVEPLERNDTPGFKFRERDARRPVRMWCICETEDHAVECFLSPAEVVDEKLYE